MCRSMSHIIIYKTSNCMIQGFNPYPAEFFYLNFPPLEVVSHYRDPQTQAIENYSYLFNLRPSIYKFILMFKHQFLSQCQ